MWEVNPSDEQWKWIWHGGRAVETMFAILNIEGETILDVGCSESQLAYCLDRLGYKAYGIDIRDIKHDFNGFFIMDATNMRFKDATFDTVTCISVVEHIKNYKKAFKEIKRVLKPDGVFILTVPYGKGSTETGAKRYLTLELVLLLDGLKIEEQRFFRDTDSGHTEHDGSKEFKDNIILIKARKCANTNLK